MNEFILESTDYTTFITDSDSILLEVGMQGIPDKGAPDIKRGKYTKIKIINNIIQTLKKILDMFRNKASDMMKRSMDYINKLDPNRINYSKLELNLDINYFKSQDIISEFNNSNLFRSLTNRNSYNADWIRRTFSLEEGQSLGMETMISNNMFKQFISSEGSLSEGCKSYFRFGNAEYKQKNKQLKINEIKYVVEKASTYCKNYTKIVSSLTNSNKRVQDTLKTLENKQSVNESINWYDDEVFESFNTILFENVEDNPNKDNTTGTESKNEPTSSSSTSQSSLENQFIKNSAHILQVMISSAMTIAEERFNTYMNILKYCTTKIYKDSESGDIIDSNKQANHDEYKKETGVVKKGIDKGKKAVKDKIKNKINNIGK